MIAIYVRQSVDKKDSISIESQVDFCKKEILPDDKIKVYSDKGYSGKNTQRPSFAELESDIKNNLIKKVVVYKLDRISRSVLDFAQIINLFETHNVDFVSCNEKFDTSTPIGKAMLSIIMVFAQLERETIQLRITDNYYSRGRKGMYLGGTPPYGFCKIETTYNGHKTKMYSPVPEQIDIVKRIFSEYLTPLMSLGKIAKGLNEDNIPTLHGAKWDNSKISRILSNPSYVKADSDIYSYYKSKGCIIANEIDDFTGTNGCYLYGKRNANDRKYTNVENHTLSIAPHEGIISAQDFLMVADKLSKNKQIKNSNSGNKSWLQGLLKCGICNSSLSIKETVSKTKKGIIKYKAKLYCQGKQIRHNCIGFKTPPFVKDVECCVEKEILSAIDKHKSLSYVSKINTAKQGEIKIKIVKITEQIDHLISQIALGNASVSKYLNQKIAELDAEKNELEGILRETWSINKQTDEFFKMSDLIDEWSNLNLQKKKQIAAFFIKQVKILDDVVEIVWNYNI